MNADLDGEDFRWVIMQDGFTAALANFYETLFTTGNGYLGTRGSLEEGHDGALPGTFLRGVFDHHDSAVPELVKGPDWLSLSVVVNGVRLDVSSAPVVRHRRILDMREGTVFRDTVFEDCEGRQTRLETVHFASRSDQHLCCLQARITPENHTAPVIVRSGIDGTVYNLDRRPLYAEPPPDDPQMTWHKWAKSKHLDEVAREQLPDGIYLETRTIDTGITIGYAALTTLSPAAESSVEQRHKYIEQVSRTNLAAGNMLTVDKLVAVYTSRDVPAASVRRACLDELGRHAAAGFMTCRERNRAAWQPKWADSDVTIDGDPGATRAVRFSLYQLLIAANESDPRVSIGANGLSGERYRGHVFWDTEVFMLPFFIYTQPATARALLLYHNDQRGPGALAVVDLERAAQHLNVVGVADPGDVPAIPDESGGHVLGERQGGAALDGDVVAVVNPAQVGQLQVSGQGCRLARDTFHEVAVAAQHIDVVVEHYVARPVEMGRRPAAGHGHADRGSCSGAERPGRCLHPRGQAVVRVTGAFRTQLPKVLHVIERH